MSLFNDYIFTVIIEVIIILFFYKFLIDPFFDGWVAFVLLAIVFGIASYITKEIFY